MEAVPPVVHGCRFAERLSVEVGHLIRSDDKPIRVPRGHLGRLRHSPVPGGLFRNRPLDRRLVDVGCDTLGLDPRIPQHL
jgi:hypothetical protein